ncbi:hypothetical protein [Azospirillum himalayense]|uniref:Uncharacterized protein n=1 Tax=Azospirillum himalayense TaxID=654847 RepID=A0ABW0G2B1_9PROT
MASKRRKASRKTGRGRSAAGRSLAGESMVLEGRAPRPQVRTTPVLQSRGNAKRSVSLDGDSGAFLGPEQQYLLRKRQEVERREARLRRTVAGVLVALAAAAAGGLFWAFGGV